MNLFVRSRKTIRSLAMEAAEGLSSLRRPAGRIVDRGHDLLRAGICDGHLEEPLDQFVVERQKVNVGSFHPIGALALNEGSFRWKPWYDPNLIARFAARFRVGRAFRPNWETSLIVYLAR
jgi:hypothetical protein